MAKNKILFGVNTLCFTILCILPCLQANGDLSSNHDLPSESNEIASFDPDHDKDPDSEENRQMARRALKQYGQGKLYLNRVEKVVKIGASAPLTIMNFIAFGANPTPIPCQAKFKENDGKETIDVCCLDFILSIEEENQSYTRGSINDVNYDEYNVGDIVEQDPKRPLYRQYAEFIIKNRNPRLKLKRVTRVRSRVVSGFLYNIDFDAKQNKILVKCESELWEQPWKTPKLQVKKFRCFSPKK